MDEKRTVYAHSLLFRCRGCEGPIAISVIRAESNLEVVDGRVFNLLCKCGWLKRAMGLEAVSHYVTPWERQPSIDDARVIDAPTLQVLSSF